MYKTRIHVQLLPGIILAFLVLLTGCGNNTPDWQSSKRAGILRFTTTFGPGSYFETRTGAAGFEYELAQQFAVNNGLKLKLIPVNKPETIREYLVTNKALIGGGLLVTRPQDNLSMGPPYLNVPLELVYRRGDKKPDNLKTSPDSNLVISREEYENLKVQYPELKQNINDKKTTSEILEMIQTNSAGSTIANSMMVSLYRQMYPDIKVAFKVSNPLPVSWLYRSNDVELDRAIKKFFSEINENGVLDKLLEKYFGSTDIYDYIEQTTFLSRIPERLHLYEPLFRKIADRYYLDWTLLAAISYQESHWQVNAKSPTGVRGLMMITQDTAKHLGIDDRTDPEQSIEGGTRYYIEMLDKIPDRIQMPDRRWLALAAYNVGFQNLETARVITQKDGGNPDHWNDVSKTMKKLQQQSYKPDYTKSTIRWSEPVRYVNNIRVYRDLLRWEDYKRYRNKPESEPVDILSTISPAL